MAEDLKTLVRLRGRLKGSITRLLAFAKNPPEDASVAEVTARSQRLRELWGEFESSTRAIYPFADQPDCPDVDEDFAEYEDKFIAARGLLDGLREALAPLPRSGGADESVSRLADQQAAFIQQLSCNSPPISQPRGDEVPRINIPPFSGSYKDWPSFKDLFLSAVGSKPNLTNTQKFHHLKSLLRDEAAQMLKHIPITEASYDTAWERLHERYNRPRHIVTSFIEAFMSLPTTATENTTILRRISDGANEVIRGLRAISQDDRDCWLIHWLLAKLDADSRRKWIEESKYNETPTIDEFCRFLDSHCEELELTHHKVNTTKPRQPSARSFVALNETACLRCNRADHSLAKCPEFASRTQEERRAFIRDKRLCFNCLRGGHVVASCGSKYSCRTCNRRHHTLLHGPRPGTGAAIPAATSATSRTPSTVRAAPEATVSHVARPVAAACQQDDLNPFHKATISLLPTALVDVQASHGGFVKCRLLLDTASELSYITERCAQKLAVTRSSSRIAVSGISSSRAETTRGRCSLLIKSHVSDHTLSITAHILSNITATLPTTTIEISSKEKLEHIALADPTFNVSASIDILLGAKDVWKVFTCQRLYDSHDDPIAISSIFGWVITSTTGRSASATAASLVTTNEVDHFLRQFWELEEPNKLPPSDDNEAFVEQHFQRTHARHEDGRYLVQLPFKEEQPQFADTLSGALARFHAVERRLQRNDNLRQQYNQFMHEYEALGHMRQLPPDEVYVADRRVFYLPHHPVLGKKLRVVFDGSFEDNAGTSLNSTLHIGPSIQRNLFSVCLRFRLYRYVFSADIVKMFRQIWVADHHRNYQHILWRESPTEPIKHYQLCTVTYGTACAPFLAVRVLAQLAHDYQDQFPLASSVLRDDFYVDDVLTGSDSEQALIDKRNELVKLLSHAGLELRKWVSNCRSITEDVHAEHTLGQDTTKVLGLLWKAQEDVLTYQTHVHPIIDAALVTKRRVLSDASRIFDPLGLLSPITVQFKILFQESWLQKLNWDDQLPPAFAERWLNYHHDIHHITQLSLARFVPTSADEIELHGFSDAPMKAYAAAVYCHFQNEDGTHITSLLTAKTRVAPLKQVSLPRLELCGALLLTRLIKTVIDILPHTSVKTVAWCDSTVVLAWLSQPPVKLKTFVGNRTAEILDTLPRNVWNHIPSKENPADCASRGMPAHTLLEFDLWWKGPDWLSSHVVSMPEQPLNFELLSVPEAEAEQRKTLLVTNEMEDDPLTRLLERVSSWPRLLRITAYVVRFTYNSRPANQRPPSRNLAFAEIDNARIIWLRHAQRCYAEELQHLRHGREISSRSKLLQLAPFLDENGLLRVGDRIRHSNLEADAQHPIILPRKHRVAELILLDEHMRNLHPGVSALFVIARQKYWIIGARNMIRKLTHDCIKCFRQRRTTTQQFMADLPSARVRQAFPFQHTGCDYAGPLTLKLHRGRNARTSKGYICLFVCLVTSAIHLELAADLSTEGFLAAFRRFISRRGKCTEIFSDNGRNFVGAARALDEMRSLLMSQQHNEQVSLSLAEDGIHWKFIPPHAPHWGGIWESAVRSVKLHLRRVIGATILATEQMHTLLAQIEAVVNSRPLGAAPDTDTNYLSPSHFLIGGPYTLVPEGNLGNIEVNRLDYWQNVQSMYQGFWKRWHQEYLTSLQNRPKWTRRTPNVAVGDVVVIKENNLPPATWPIARVIEVHTGKDGLVRAATLRTAKGEATRPITKLAILPVS